MIPDVDWNRVALVTIDMQRDFVLGSSAAAVKGTQEVVPRVREALDLFRKWRRPIIHVVRLYLPDGSNAELCRRDGIAAGQVVVAPYSTGAEIAGELLPDASMALDADLLLGGKVQSWTAREWVVFKPRWGGFYQTPLEDHLRSQRINSLIFCGCNFPNCPRASLYEASERDYRLALLVDATSKFSPGAKPELEGLGVNVWTVSDLADKGAANAPMDLRRI
jgi:nicotinamidase-related amidase